MYWIPSGNKTNVAVMTVLYADIEKNRHLSKIKEYTLTSRHEENWNIKNCIYHNSTRTEIHFHKTAYLTAPSSPDHSSE